MTGKFKEMGEAIGNLVEEKNLAYGDSFAQSNVVLHALFPDGIQVEQYRDLLAVTRVIDKLFRIANDKEAFGESPWKDIAGYGILGAVNDEGPEAVYSDIPNFIIEGGKYNFGIDKEEGRAVIYKSDTVGLIWEMPSGTILRHGNLDKIKKHCKFFQEMYTRGGLNAEELVKFVEMPPADECPEGLLGTVNNALFNSNTLNASMEPWYEKYGASTDEPPPEEDKKEKGDNVVNLEQRIKSWRKS